MSEEDRKKMSDLREKMRGVVTGRAREAAKGNVGPADQGGHHRDKRGQGRGGDGAGRRWTGTRGSSAASGGQGRGGAGGGADPIAAMLRRGVNVGGFTGRRPENAKLPLPPEQDSQVQVLLRPGLLADVEIQVEKLPDVIHVPAQAVFQKNGQYLVYVHGKEREVRGRAR
mgnify:CR=1 FL=1